MVTPLTGKHVCLVQGMGMGPNQWDRGGPGAPWQQSQQSQNGFMGGGQPGAFFDEGPGRMPQGSPMFGGQQASQLGGGPMHWQQQQAQQGAPWLLLGPFICAAPCAVRRRHLVICKFQL